MGKEKNQLLLTEGWGTLGELVAGEALDWGFVNCIELMKSSPRLFCALKFMTLCRLHV